MTPLQRRILQRLEQVKPGTTVCPGRLARDCGTTLSAAREDILELARARKIALTQGGRRASIAKLKGPFRVAPLPL